MGNANFHLRSGSTSLTTNGAGNIAASIKYFPFGVCRNSQGTLDTDKLFTGQRLDQTGLYFYNARYYDATIGRFISPDTYIQNPADPQCLNRYSYCSNNPLKYTDSSGHFLDFFVDLFFVCYDIYEICTDLGDATNWGALAADVGCAILPGLTGGGEMVRGVEKAFDAAKDLEKADELGHMVNGIEKTTKETIEAAKNADKVVDGMTGLKGGKAAINLGTEATKTVKATDEFVSKTAEAKSQVHHFATNCNKKYTPEMKEIAKKYNLGLNEEWNKAPIPGHSGRHAKDYHQWVLANMRKISSSAQNADEFKAQFNALVVDPVKSNPEMLKKSWW
jgi:RHS repeat-associated protein